MRTLSTFASSALLALALAGCQATDSHSSKDSMAADPHAAHAHASAWSKVSRAVCVLYPTRGNQASGTLTFDKVEGGVHVHGTVSGLEPKSSHAIHIHEFGDASAPDGTSAGAHYNPEGHNHAGPTTPERHAGDLGNLLADDAGTATFDLTVDNISLADLRNPIIGRGVVVHAKTDDYTTQPTGNAGGRIAVGVIGIARTPDAPAPAPAKKK